MIRSMLRLILPEKLKRGIIGLIAEETNLTYPLLKAFPSDSRIMLDVGAGYGSTFLPFAVDGWNVYAFEPDLMNRKKANKFSAMFNSVTIDPRAVSNRIESDVTFYRSDVSSGISGLSRFDPSHKKAGSVNTVTLDVFCQEHHISEIDYLKIDAEGYDLFVLQSLSLDVIKPDVIMCEFENIKTIPLGYTLDDMGEYLIEKGYSVLVSEWYPVVKRGGPHRWRRFMNYPCDLIDPNAWGNIIAVSDQLYWTELERLTAATNWKWKVGNVVWKFLDMYQKCC